ncbi:hypothetical protein ACP4OV_013270 [Aristida adscensionis]
MVRQAVAVGRMGRPVEVYLQDHDAGEHQNDPRGVLVLWGGSLVINHTAVTTIMYCQFYTVPRRFMDSNTTVYHQVKVFGRLLHGERNGDRGSFIIFDGSGVIKGVIWLVYGDVHIKRFKRWLENAGYAMITRRVTTRVEARGEEPYIDAYSCVGARPIKDVTPPKALPREKMVEPPPTPSSFWDMIGVHVPDIVSISGRAEPEVRLALESLANEALIYTTADDDHYRAI